MDLPTLSAAALGLALLAAAPDSPASASDNEASMETGDLVGAHLYASDAHIPRWGDAVLADDVALRDLGRIEAIVDAADGAADRVVVSVGGLWGLGAQEVEIGMDRLLTLPAADGGSRIVVDLSAEGSASILG